MCPLPARRPARSTRGPAARRPDPAYHLQILAIRAGVLSRLVPVPEGSKPPGERFNAFSPLLRRQVLMMGHDSCLGSAERPFQKRIFQGHRAGQVTQLCDGQRRNHSDTPGAEPVDRRIDNKMAQDLPVLAEERVHRLRDNTVVLGLGIVRLSVGFAFCRIHDPSRFVAATLRLVATIIAARTSGVKRLRNPKCAVTPRAWWKRLSDKRSMSGCTTKSWQTPRMSLRAGRRPARQS